MSSQVKETKIVIEYAAGRIAVLQNIFMDGTGEYVVQIGSSILASSSTGDLFGIISKAKIAAATFESLDAMTA